MGHKGSCHCGRIAFEAEGASAGEDALATYTFNKHVIRHHFCPTCSCAPFGFGTDPSGKPTAAVNVGCLEGIDLSSLKRLPFDGCSL